ncbi:hypothetical protein DM01DRAFT_1339253 [Hesseltinella vesiculosa]|uniref:Fungal-type protein kinase domain-containing protein n=1 Tax=Hesseltinella vesiculosa TaxID=101127 RepID=A0A1X2G7Y2_9FUNG|nr:hypothetical protein DM01DRAFT_1339253 [Hesseltinella vesiculosa]
MFEGSNLTDTRIKLLELSIEAEGYNKNVLLAIESLLPALKDLNIDHVGESELTSSYIHPFIQALFAIDRDNTVAKCANITTFDEDSRKRPDYAVDIFDSCTYDFTSCVGEVKPKNATQASKVVDFVKLCTFAAEALKDGLNHFIFFQALDKEVTFYHMIYKAGIYATVEIGTVTIPTRKNDLVNIISCLDTMTTVAEIHADIKHIEGANKITYAPVLPLDIGSLKKSLPVKRKPSLSTIH